jgi:PAS domain S-box-containing protein
MKGMGDASLVGHEIALLETLFERMPVGIAVFDCELVLQRCNPTWAGFFDRYVPGVAGRVAPGKSLYELAPGAANGLRPLVEQVLAGETIRGDGLRFDNEGGVSWWDIVLAPVVEDGRVVGILDVTVDATERKQAEAALAEREAQYRSIFDATSDGLVINDPQTGIVVEANAAFCRMHGYTHEEVVGLHPSAFIHPDSHHLFEKYVETVRAGRDFFTRAMDVRKDGSVFHVEVHGTGFLYRGRTHLLGVVRDITEQVQAVQLLEQRVEERTRELSTLLEISHNVTSTLELQPLLGLILDQLKAVVDYAGASILTVDGNELTILDSRATAVQTMDVLGQRFPGEGAEAIWRAIIRREPVIVADVRGDTPLAQAYRAAVGDLMETPAYAYVRSWLAVPLALKERVIGLLSISSREPNYYTPRHAGLALAIANQAAVAIDNARLYQQAQELAALEERQRLARELHDSVTQSLFSMTLMSRALPRLLDREPVRAREQLERLSELSQGALAEMRALIFELRPESLADEGLVNALTKQADGLRARHGIDIAVALGQEPDLPLDTKHALYRIAQEALHNAIKHARARHLRLRLEQTAQDWVLEVSDDGVGFDPAASFAGHLGLHSMRERAAALRGSLEIDSAPGRGTHIIARIPAHEGS